MNDSLHARCVSERVGGRLAFACADPHTHRMPNHSSLFSIVFAATLAVGCGDGPRSTRTDSAGIAIVANDNTGVWTDADRPTLTQVLRIGSQADSLYQFGSIRGLDIGTAGVIAVLDAQAAAVRLYDSTGKYLKSIGRRGNGPGELHSGVDDLMIGSGDTVLIGNGMKSGVLRLLLEGRSLPGFEVPDEAFESPVQLDTRWQKHPQGGAVQQIIGRRKDSTEVYPPYRLLRLTASGAIDTIFTLPSGRTVQPRDSVPKLKPRVAFSDGAVDESMFGSMDTPEIRFFAPEPVWALTDNGAVHFAMSSEYAIHMHDGDGALKRIVRRAVKAQPLTEKDQEAGHQLLRKSMAGDGASAAEVDEMLKPIKFADEFPILIRIMGGPEGSLWVQRAAERINFSAIALDQGLDAFASPLWDVFANDGTFMGAVRLPDRFVPTRWVGDRLLGIAYDENQVQNVAIVRAQPEGVLKSLSRSR